VPILDPITAGGPTTALDEPSDDEIMRAFERADPVQGGLPLLHEIQRNNVRIVKEKIADYIDPPRVYPLIGPAQLHHAHYKCTIYYTEVTRVGWPVPYTTRNEDAVEVIYIDHNHFHMVGNPDTGMTVHSKPPERPARWFNSTSGEVSTCTRRGSSSRASSAPTASTRCPACP
jgi:hypothetical protein